jgi:spore coat polysaccharide biosynthesis protein SpsF
MQLLSTRAFGPGHDCENQPVTTLAILQARMTSTRLPGKILAPILGEPMVGRQLERIRRAQRLDDIVLATSTDPSDEPLVAWAEANEIKVSRGSLADVLHRFVEVIDHYQPDVVVRLTADCPLTSPKVIDAVIERFQASDVDYCSNTLTPTFPDGLDVEVVKAYVLREVAAASTDPHEREHVTLGVYRHPERYRLTNFEGSEDHSDLRWTVDTPEDLAFITAVYEALYPDDPEFEMCDVLELITRTPGLLRTTEHVMRNAALTGLNTGAMIV